MLSIDGSSIRSIYTPSITRNTDVDSFTNKSHGFGHRSNGKGNGGKGARAGRVSHEINNTFGLQMDYGQADEVMS